MSTPGNFAPAGPPQRSGGSNVLMIVLIVGGVILLVCAGICGGCMIVARNTVNQVGNEVGAAIELSAVHDQAMEAVVNDPQVKEKLGGDVGSNGIPVREGSGEVKPAGETFHFDVEGSNGTAKATCTAMKDAGVWRLTVITVQGPDGASFNVPPPEPAGPEMQFDSPEEPADETTK